MTHSYAVRLGWMLFGLLVLVVNWANSIAQKHLVSERIMKLDPKAQRRAAAWPTPDNVEPGSAYWIYVRRGAMAAIIFQAALDVFWHT
jgi:hypothetical protein